MKQVKNWILGGLLAVMLTATASATSYVERVANPYFDGDYATTLAKITPLAEAGDAEAQYWLGDMYDHGRGVDEDDAEAVKWYRLAAEQGNADAQYDLGRMYDWGYGVEQDDAEAVKWYRRAAESGQAYAQHALGSRYENGRGVEKDIQLAYMWYRLAADQGVLLRAETLGKLIYGMTETKEMAKKCRAQNYKNCDKLAAQN